MARPLSSDPSSGTNSCSAPALLQLFHVIALDFDCRRRIRICCDELNLLVPFCNAETDKATTLQWTTAFLKYIQERHGDSLKKVGIYQLPSVLTCHFFPKIYQIVLCFMESNVTHWSSMNKALLINGVIDTY